MNSHLTIIAKKLVVLTLIVGFLVMPVAPILAEETVAPVSDPVVEISPVVEDIVPIEVVPEVEIISETPEEEVVIAEEEPVLEEVTEDVAEEVIEEETPVLEVSEPVIVSNYSSAPKVALVVNAKAIDFADENSFTTTSDDPVDPVVVETTSFALESNFTTLEGDPVVSLGDLAISSENSFTTSSGDVVSPTTELSVGNEGQFTTLPETAIITDNLALGTENSFTTLPDVINPGDNFAISVENSFTTLDNSTEGNTTVSEENSFTTLDDFNNDNTTISDEQSFTTLRGDDEETDLVISDEQSFTTLDNSNEDNTAVSEEMSFSTLDNGTGDPDGENSFTTLSNGSNGGGGGGSRRGGSVTAPEPYVCGILLHEFIKYGRANNRLEVIKLQIFLRVFEDFDNLQVTGVYDLSTYRAVEIFQKRYSRDVLGPWGITDSTGYVFITTRLAINNIFCGRSTENDLDLRNFYREYEEATGEVFVPTLGLDDSTMTDDEGYTLTPATTTGATSTSVVKRNWLMAGLGGLLDFVGDNLCWLLNLLLLLIILFLLWLLWSKDRDDDNSVGGEPEPFKGHIVNGDMGLIGAVALDEIMSEDDKLVLDALAEEEDSQIPAANNDPDQHSIEL